MQEQIVQRPVWVDAKGATQATGLTRMSLWRLSKDGKVESRKLGPDKRSKRLYRLSSVLSFIENSEQGGER